MPYIDLIKYAGHLFADIRDQVDTVATVRFSGSSPFVHSRDRGVRW